MILNLPFTKKYRVRCKDGSVKTVYRHIDDVYPLITKDKEQSSKGNVTIEGIGGANLDTQSRTKIQGLLMQLDSQTSTLIPELRQAYIAYESDPCKGYDRFIEESTAIFVRQDRLKQLEIKIQAYALFLQISPANIALATTTYQEIVSGLSAKTSGDEVAKEIASNKDEAKKQWGGGDNYGG